MISENSPPDVKLGQTREPAANTWCLDIEKSLENPRPLALRLTPS